MSEQPISIELDEPAVSQIVDQLENASYDLRRASDVFSMLFEGIASGTLEGSAETMAVCELAACGLLKKAEDNDATVERIVSYIRRRAHAVREKRAAS